MLLIRRLEVADWARASEAVPERRKWGEREGEREGQRQPQTGPYQAEQVPTASCAFEE